MTDTTGPGAEAAGGGDGLSSDEARRRLRTEGPNRLEAVPATARWRRRLGPLLDPMVLLLLAAAPTYFAIGETVDGVVALVALIPVVGAGWLLEARAERSLDELRAMSARTATVRRDGRTATIPADEVVPGDLLVLREGDVVPADGRVVDATQLDLDESSLTGESLPVAKSIDGDVDVWAGTTVVSGAATVTVTATGGRTRFGHVGALLAGATPPRTPFQQALARLVTRLAVGAVVLSSVVFAVEVLRGNGWAAGVIAAVSFALAAIPEEFALV